jgi:hypothetical protein
MGGMSSTKEQRTNNKEQSKTKEQRTMNREQSKTLVRTLSASE